jgi:two-component system, NtrC family, response regulator HydG
MRARLIVESGDCLPAALDLSPDQSVTLGRGRDNTLVLRDVLASRLHAKIYFEDSHWQLRDFGLNGTRLDGKRITGGAELSDGRAIKIGEVTLRFTTLANGGLATPAPILAAPVTLPCRRAGTENNQTKVYEVPAARNQPSDPPPEESAKQRRMDELTALCKFMASAVEMKLPHDLIALALRAILHQTTARLVGYLSFDADDPTPKIVMPESAAVDVPLSRRLTQRAYQTGKTVWLFPDLTASHAPTDSLSSFADALCIPLKSSGESFAALHVYRSGRAFLEQDVRFIEAIAGFLAHGLEIHRNRRKLEAENSRLRTHTPAADEIIGESAAVTHLRQQIYRAAPQSLTVLVQGESGSGKELVALAIHGNSRRAAGPLVVVNCAAITPSTLDAELFGYAKGAFGGETDQPGLFQQADEGTLFLDEVSEFSLECQAKVLRVIEGKAFRPIGAKHDVKSDVRIVAATQRDLEKEVKAGRFRPDLYFRLKVIQIQVPPLREHPEDIPELAQFFLAKVSNECRRTFRLTPSAMRKLQSYAWPGNVRQLRALIESAAVMSESDVLDADVIPLAVAADNMAANAPCPAPDLPLSLDMDEIETWAIHRALRQTNGNVSHAAKLLGMSRDTLHTKIKKKSIDREALANTPEPVGVAALTMT